MNQETILMRKIMLALSTSGHIAFRNETGKFWTGRVIHKDNNSVTLSNAQMLPVGLCVGSADIIGIQSNAGRFFAIEVKTGKGKTTKEQDAFLLAVQEAGGVSGVARSVQDALELLSPAE